MQDRAKFLSDIAGSDIEARFAAWRGAGEQSADVIPELGKLAGSSDPGVAKAAREAMKTMTHAVGKDPAAPKRAEVVKGLLRLAESGYALSVRAYAYRMLSQIAGEDSVASIAKGLQIAELREEAVYCLERIPGTASNRTLAAAYREAGEDFKARILAALGHRRAEEGVPLCLEAAKSPNKELAIAALKAWSRIGKRTTPLPRAPETGLSAWQKTEQTDSLVRYAEAQVKQGNGTEALRVFRTLLDRPEEHVQCAAMVGIAKIGTAEAAGVIFPKLKSADRKVRITARQAWEGMARG
jgi:hypothetical protein